MKPPASSPFFPSSAAPQDALEYLIKWKGVSYMHVEWVTPNLMREYRQWGVARMQRMVGSEEGQVRSLIVTQLCNQRDPPWLFTGDQSAGMICCV